ncbi:MAG: hypothetical protein QOJ70_3048 [Acidobacteriota bacterium]|jgi:hypothetical protein|nr:hypothetical protein [Acidobacteriota bacterium]
MTGLVASRKNDRMTGFESSLERDFLLLLDFDAAVARYEEQPVRIKYVDATGRRRTYTPDVLVHYHDDLDASADTRPLLCEVKYREDLFANWKEYKPKIRAGRAHARGQGWRFQIVTEREVRTPYLENAKFLRPYRRIETNHEDTALLLDTLRGMDEADPESVLATIHHDRTRRAELLPMLWRLLADGHITADLSRPLTMRTRISVAGSPERKGVLPPL